MANLFTSQTPTVTDASDGSPGITTATTVRFAQAGTVTGIRFYATATVSGTYAGLLWEVDDSDDTPAGTLLASETMGVAPTGGAWNTITFDAPVAVVTNTLYRAGIFSGAGRYVATTLFFVSDVVNGDITGDANGDDPVGLGSLRQGTFAINAAATYPSGAGNGTCYFVDVEFTGGTTPLAPTGIEVPVTLGAPALSFTATLMPDGIGASVSLGAPTIDGPPGPEPEVAPGSWYGLLNAVNAARADHVLNRERELNPVECPYDGWPLTPTPRGLHCEFGGHIVKGK